MATREVINLKQVMNRWYYLKSEIQSVLENYTYSKKELYTKSEVYSKDETYSKTQIDNPTFDFEWMHASDNVSDCMISIDYYRNGFAHVSGTFKLKSNISAKETRLVSTVVSDKKNIGDCPHFLVLGTTSSGFAQLYGYFESNNFYVISPTSLATTQNAVFSFFAIIPYWTDDAVADGL